MGLFAYSEERGAFVAEFGDVLVQCENPEGDEAAYAQKLAVAYKEQLPELVDFMLEDICDFFGEVERDALPGLLGTPLIDMDREVVTYLGHTLDDVHLIDVEFGGLFDEFYEVVIDG